ncbi:MAG: hypothetical protein HND56_07185 [Pseudomonadota bacterium]|nr:hypothetical protein [Pseudomonadota bacterium]QKK04154.1 MAG: hypothetical protein HND56_07185 [Pseudomonadota bacterium]
MIKYYMLYPLAVVMFMMLCLKVLAGEPETVKATEPNDLQAFCRFYIVHEPAADVPYQPGVDVHGRPVVGADVDPSAAVLDVPMEFALSIDLADYLGIARPQGVQMETKPIPMRIEDGRVLVNGQALSGEGQEMLRAFCAEKREKTLDNSTGSAYKDIHK